NLAPRWPARRIRAALRAARDTDIALKNTTISDAQGLLTDLVLQITIQGGDNGDDGKGGSMSGANPDRKRGLAGAILSVLFILWAFPAAAQTDSRLVEAIRQAQEGGGESARSQVRRLLAATSPTDTLYPQIIYTQAMIASDANEMRRTLQRVAVEYSSSSWADDALLRLVQLDYASGNLPGAAHNLERIRLDYPGSILLPQASYWAARTYFDQKNPEMACRWIADGLGASSSNVELQNQLGYLNQRCAGVRTVAARPAADSQPDLASGGTDTATLPPNQAESPAPTAAVPPPSSTPPPAQPTTPALPRTNPAPGASPPPAAGTRYRIQITAVRSPATAESMVTRLKAQGLTVVTIEEGGLFKVRVGDYATRPEAIAVLPDLKARLGGSPFVVAEP
ncbi:MAG: SPOR domain-containing protein, partial [Gemmatimonadales bacterium]